MQRKSKNYEGSSSPYSSSDGNAPGCPFTFSSSSSPVLLSLPRPPGQSCCMMAFGGSQAVWTYGCLQGGGVAEGRPWDPQRGGTNPGFSSDISAAGGWERRICRGPLGWRSAAAATADVKTLPLPFSFMQSDVTGKLLMVANTVRSIITEWGNPLSTYDSLWAWHTEASVLSVWFTASPVKRSIIHDDGSLCWFCILKQA